MLDNGFGPGCRNSGLANNISVDYAAAGKPGEAASKGEVTA
jgi:hypothetical protein